MIRTIVHPSADALKKNFMTEPATYSDAEWREADRDLFNRMHEAWTGTGEIWLIHEEKDGSEDRVLLKTLCHVTGPNHNLVFEVEEGET